jgi:hypothetical protein
MDIDNVSNSGNSNSGNSNSGDNSSGRRGFPDLSYMDLFTQANLAIDDLNNCNKNPVQDGIIVSPILYEPIEPSGPVTPGLSINDVLLDPKRKFIKVPEIDISKQLIGFTCYEKSEFIYYIKTKIVDNIIKKENRYKILSPTTQLPIPKQIIDMLNSLFDIDSYINANIDIVTRNQKSYEMLISPTFYYSYGNPNNDPSYHDIYFLNQVYQYFTTNGELLASHFPNDYAFASHMITINLRSYINNLIYTIGLEEESLEESERQKLISLKESSRQELAIFVRTQVESQFLPFVIFNTNSQGNIISYNFHFENHPYFMPEFREIFTSNEVTNFSNRTERRPGVLLNTGKETIGDIIGVHGNSKELKILNNKIKKLYETMDNEKVTYDSSSGGSKKKKRKNTRKKNKKKRKNTRKKN